MRTGMGKDIGIVTGKDKLPLDWGTPHVGLGIGVGIRISMGIGLEQSDFGGGTYSAQHPSRKGLRLLQMFGESSAHTFQERPYKVIAIQHHESPEIITHHEQSSLVTPNEQKPSAFLIDHAQASASKFHNKYS